VDILSSQNGINWLLELEKYYVPYHDNFSYVNGKYFIANKYSNDLINWTDMEIGTGVIYRKYVYGNGYYIAIPSNGGYYNEIIKSSDLINWTKINVVNKYWNDIIYANGLFVMIGGNNSNHTGYFAYSNNGTTWTINNVGTDIHAVSYGNGIFVATGYGYNGICSYYSTNGITWNPVYGDYLNDLGSNKLVYIEN
jgi:hypothetical protein